MGAYLVSVNSVDENNKLAEFLQMQEGKKNPEKTVLSSC